MSDEKPALLFWLDLETTGLEPEEDLVLEGAWILTEFAYPYRELRRGGFLARHRSEDLQNLNPFVYAMHERSGLLHDLREHRDKALPILDVEAQLLEVSADWPPAVDEDPDVVRTKMELDVARHAYSGTYGKQTGQPSGVAQEAKLAELRGAHSRARSAATDRRVVCAGSSVAFDKSFLRRHLPELHDRISHRVFDASNLSLVCRSMGMPRLPKPDDTKAHRAGYDVQQSIEMTRACVRWLLSLDPVVKVGFVREPPPEGYCPSCWGEKEEAKRSCGSCSGTGTIGGG